MSNYVPTSEMISTKPRVGFFYARPMTKGPVTIAQVAYVAAREAGGIISTANMVKRIAESEWNQSHFDYAVKGSSQNYTNYGFPGPQYQKEGAAYPLLWIPTPDGKEPEDVFGSPSAEVVSPGFSVPTPSDTVATPGLSAGTPTSSRGSGSPDSGGTSLWTGGGSSSSSSSRGGVPVASEAGFPWGWALVALGGAAAVYYYLRKGK